MKEKIHPLELTSTPPNLSGDRAFPKSAKRAWRSSMVALGRPGAGNIKTDGVLFQNKAPIHFHSLSYLCASPKAGTDSGQPKT